VHDFLHAVISRKDAPHRVFEISGFLECPVSLSKNGTFAINDAFIFYASGVFGVCDAPTILVMKLHLSSDPGVAILIKGTQ